MNSCRRSTCRLLSCRRTDISSGPCGLNAKSISNSSIFRQASIGGCSCTSNSFNPLTQPASRGVTANAMMPGTGSSQRSTSLNSAPKRWTKPCRNWADNGIQSIRLSFPWYLRHSFRGGRKATRQAPGKSGIDVLDGQFALEQNIYALFLVYPVFESWNVPMTRRYLLSAKRFGSLHIIRTPTLPVVP